MALFQVCDCSVSSLWGFGFRSSMVLFSVFGGSGLSLWCFCFRSLVVRFRCGGSVYCLWRFFGGPDPGRVLVLC